MHSACWAGPFEYSARTLFNGPLGVMLERVVAAAQRPEIVGGSLAAERGVDRVVEVAALDRDSATREPAVPVAGSDDSADLLAGAVPVY